MTEKEPAEHPCDLPPHPGVKHHARGGRGVTRFLKPLQYGKCGRRKDLESQALPGALRAEYPVRSHVHADPSRRAIHRLPAIGADAHIGSEPDDPEQVQFKVV